MLQTVNFPQQETNVKMSEDFDVVSQAVEN